MKYIRSHRGIQGEQMEQNTVTKEKRSYSLSIVMAEKGRGVKEE